MTEGGLGTAFWKARWSFACWAGPALLLAAFAHQVILPLAARQKEAGDRLAVLRENIYEEAWLDSTQAALRADVELLRDFHRSRRDALARDSSVQAAIDRIRGLAQKSGIEVIKTTPAVGRADSLGLLKVRLEGFTRHKSLLDFFVELRDSHPDLYLEEMLIRQGGDRSGGRLESVLVLHSYSLRQEALR